MTDFPVVLGDRDTLKKWKPLLEGLTTDGTLITDQTSVTPATGDSILLSDVSDSGNLKKTTITNLSTQVGSDLNITSGTYTPTLTNNTNLSASTAFSLQYMRVGDVVTVGGQVNADAIATGSTILFMTLPVGGAFASASELGGSGANLYGDPMHINGHNVSSTPYARFTWNSSTTFNATIHFSFTYRVK